MTHSSLTLLLDPVACVSRGYVVSVRVCMCVCMYVCILNGIIAVDSPFQTLAVDFSLNL